METELYQRDEGAASLTCIVCSRLAHWGAPVSAPSRWLSHRIPSWRVYIWALYFSAYQLAIWLVSIFQSVLNNGVMYQLLWTKISSLVGLFLSAERWAMWQLCSFSESEALLNCTILAVCITATDTAVPSTLNCCYHDPQFNVLDFKAISEPRSYFQPGATPLPLTIWILRLHFMSDEAWHYIMSVHKLQIYRFIVGEILTTVSIWSLFSLLKLNDSG